MIDGNAFGGYPGYNFMQQGTAGAGGFAGPMQGPMGSPMLGQGFMQPGQPGQPDSGQQHHGHGGLGGMLPYLAFGLLGGSLLGGGGLGSLAPLMGLAGMGLHKAKVF